MIYLGVNIKMLIVIKKLVYSVIKVLIVFEILDRKF